jgi:hypothetical protein
VVKKAERDSGVRTGATDVTTKLKALERENRELRQANEILLRRARIFIPPPRPVSSIHDGHRTGTLDEPITPKALPFPSLLNARREVGG